MATETPSSVPPYVSWGVFKSTIDLLAESTVPTGPLDRRVLHHLSGADHGALMSALRYLGLADSQRKATDTYQKLVESSKTPATFKDELCQVLDAAYDTVNKKVDLERGTISELEKAFKDEGVTQGQMLTKTVRFYIKAYVEGAGITCMSPHITKPSPKVRSASKSNGSDKSRSRVSKNSVEPPPPPARHTGDAVPTGFSRMPIPGLADAFIQYPLDLTTEQCALLEGGVAFLKVFATSKIGKEKMK